MQFSWFIHNVGKTFIKYNTSSIHVLKLVGKTFVVYCKSVKTTEIFSLRSFVYVYSSLAICLMFTAQENLLCMANHLYLNFNHLL